MRKSISFLLAMMALSFFPRHNIWAAEGFTEVNKSAPPAILNASASVFGMIIGKQGSALGSAEFVGTKIIDGQNFLVFVTAAHVMRSCTLNTLCDSVSLFKNVRIEACSSNNPLFKLYDDGCRDATTVYKVAEADQMSSRYLKVKENQLKVLKIDPVQDLAIFVVPANSLLNSSDKPVSTEQAQLRPMSLPTICDEKTGTPLYADGFPAVYLRASWVKDVKEHGATTNRKFMMERYSQGMQIDNRYCYRVNSSGKIVTQAQNSEIRCLSSKDFQASSWSTINPSIVTSCPPPQPMVQNAVTVDALSGNSGGMVFNVQGELNGLMLEAKLDPVPPPKTQPDNSIHCPDPCDGVYTFPGWREAPGVQSAPPSSAPTPHGNEYQGKDGDATNPDTMTFQSLISDCQTTKKFISEFLSQKN